MQKFLAFLQLVHLTLIALITFSVAGSAQDTTCAACNCQLNNVQVLNQLIDAKISAAVSESSKSNCYMLANKFLLHCKRLCTRQMSQLSVN